MFVTNILRVYCLTILEKVVVASLCYVYLSYVNKRTKQTALLRQVY